MKTRTIQTASPFRKNLILGIFLLFSFLLSSYKSLACTASFTYTAGVNGHYTFTSTSTNVHFRTLYSWNPGDGSGWHGQIVETVFTHTYTANNTYNVKLAISDSSGCSDTVTIPVTVSNITTPCTLSADFTYTVAPGGVVNFTSTSTGTNANTFYYWSPGDSNQRVQGSNLFTHTYLYKGIYGVWLTLSDTGNAYCIDSVYETVDVSTADSSHCHINASFTYTLGANGQVSFSSTSTGVPPNGTEYLWTPGDTTSYDAGGGTTYNHTYAYNGTYNVRLGIYSDSSECSDSITIPVTITNACNLVPDFTWAYDSAGQVKFTSTSAGTNGSTLYNWNFGDNTPTVIGTDTITHAFSFIGYYNVTLYDSTITGCTAYSTKTIYIYNKDSLNSNFIYQSDSLVNGQYDFTSTSLGTNANTYYKWTPGDGSPSDSGLGMSTYHHTYLTNGPYSASLSIWYTVLPHHPVIRSSSPRYDLSTYTTTVTVTTVATGIPSIAGDSQIYTIYPNPNNGSFRIAVNGLTSEKNAEIRISNMMGQSIYQSNAAVNGGNTLSDINLQNAASGIYLLQIITPGNTSTYRIAIQK